MSKSKIGVFINTNIKFNLIYELTLASLVIYTIIIDTHSYLDWIIWSIFVIDYMVRLYVCENKWEFVKNNVLDLIAIIPLGEFFKSARLVRLIRVIRLLTILKKRKSIFNDILVRYNIDRLFVIIVALMFIASLPMVWLEPSFDSYGDAFWWVIVTTTTVGYGDLYPETAIGRIIASFFMFVGIGLIGVVTGTVASAITSNKKNLPPELEYVRRKLDEYPSLTPSDYNDMVNHLNKMKEINSHETTNQKTEMP